MSSLCQVYVKDRDNIVVRYDSHRFDVTKSIANIRIINIGDEKSDNLAEKKKLMNRFLILRTKQIMIEFELNFNLCHH